VEKVRMMTTNYSEEEQRKDQTTIKKRTAIGLVLTAFIAAVQVVVILGGVGYFLRNVL